MRVSFTSTFTKLYRRINEENFTAGDVSEASVFMKYFALKNILQTLTLTVVNNFQVYGTILLYNFCSFRSLLFCFSDGSKSIVFATAGILGGKNFLIG